MVGTIPSISYDLKVTIWPCNTEVKPQDEIALLSYILGTWAQTSDNYSFVQTPEVCLGLYEQTITVLNLPDFVTHNESKGFFTID